MIRETITFAIVNFIILILITRDNLLFAIAWPVFWSIGRLVAQLSKNADVRRYAKIIIIIEVVMLILPINAGIKAMIGGNILLPFVISFVINWLLRE